jgi:carboxymethylenebutenolidase
VDQERQRAAEFDPELLRLFDRYVHGDLDRRAFLERASEYAVGGLTALGILQSLSPRYAWAQQVPPDDRRLRAEYVDYDSPQGHGRIRAYMARPAEARGKLPGVVVVHENRGLNPYIADVARRLGVEGFLALAPDGLTPVGGYPGDDDKGRELQAKLDRNQLLEDFVAAAGHLGGHPECTGKVGVVGFCYGGGVANALAVRLPELAAAVPFYGGQPSAADVPRIKAPLLIHYAGIDERINAGWPAYEAALKASGVRYTMHMYDGVQHGFHNDTTPRYDQAAATLAWQRTLAFFHQTLR